ncbi:Lrp/AsnC family transcriptional regulator [Sphingomonas sanguinis]|uniref:Lrp/AsnC family transcriptional regulator n=1 Tax=Sphingomonas sanguinis TaxID=33051 RepID=A0ABU5LQA1_9SPHN|nr:Lrp/AsnC family transcriptional regulator [Sphingomonas sanguinis]MDZ7282120.1 Lrp/AsnC family transcriptional regulator [Sphingomonas sanguinis]QXT35241.1 Lrp/AsnC family transcriptional regulator [Sphingomonas sanguinis]
MDTKDRQIVRLLQQDGRLTNQDLAERVGLSPSPCLRRVRLLEQAGVIQGYGAIVDQQRYGLPVTAFIRVRLERHARDLVQQFEEAIRQLDEVMDCHLLTGDADYLLRVVVADLESYERFIRRKMHAITGIASLDTTFAYGVVKSSRTFPAD